MTALISPTLHCDRSSSAPARQAAGPSPRARPVEPSAPTIDETAIGTWLARARTTDPTRLREIIAKGRLARGLDSDEVAALATSDDPEVAEELFSAARAVKETIYGRRIVLFAPLYVSNHCANECVYCAFRARNRSIERRALDAREIEAEVETLLGQGHKRLLLVAGEMPGEESLAAMLQAIERVYAVRVGADRIRRVNVNIAPLDQAGFARLARAGIGTYQLFQETYHRETYRTVHVAGRKRDYDWRLGVMDRAMSAGIDDVGLGVLFGLYDWRFELLALLEHAAHLEARYGAGPHTVSVPRIEPAAGSTLASRPPYAVSDYDFRRLIAILRLALPYTGIILSTRESAPMRQAALALGVSQISAGSRTSPGGYHAPQARPEPLEPDPAQPTAGRAADPGDAAEGAQFSLGDHRSLDEVVRDVAELGYVPSFCTACYRRGRTGADFMDLAKPGAIRLHCDPNGLCTFLEYLLDHASAETRAVGLSLVTELVARSSGLGRRRAERLLDAVRRGERDVFV